MNELSQFTNAEIIAELKLIAPSQFEKKFKEFSIEQIYATTARAVKGFSREQVQFGLDAIWDKGFLPDPIMFRQWCLGNREFSFSDEIADSYADKHAALSHIIKWLSNPNANISIAEKEAYDNTYHLWQAIKTDSDNSKAELAFKGEYEFIVKQAIKNKIPSKPYIAPIAINKTKIETNNAVDNETAKGYLIVISNQLNGKQLNIGALDSELNSEFNKAVA